MYPLLRDGDEVQVQRMPTYSIGDIIVATHPIQADITIVKRIQDIENGHFRLRGTNPKDSTDKFGLVPMQKIIGKVLLT